MACPQELKLRLKKWEREFLKVHGRKATKVDIVSSSNVIQALYKQYNAWRHSGCGSTGGRGPATRLGEDEVFGLALNKRSSSALGKKGEEPIRNKVWPLPPIVKLRGVGSKVTTHERTTQPLTRLKGSKATTSTSSPSPLPTSTQQTSPSPLPTQQASPSPLPTQQTSPSLLPTQQTSTSPLSIMAGQCRAKPMGRQAVCKYGGVSGEWLGRCKPDLDRLGEVPVDVTKGLVGVAKDSVDVTKDLVGVAKDSVGMAKDLVGVAKDSVGMAKDSVGGVLAQLELRDQVENWDDMPTIASEDEDKPVPKQKRGKTGSANTSLPLAAAGKSVSENFVRLNMKVKRYSRRPGRALTGSAYKRQEWKKRQREGEKSVPSRGKGRFVCFKCGNAGHWARNCKERGGSTHLGSFSGQKVGFSESMALGLEDEVGSAELRVLDKESPFPSVSQAAGMAAGKSADDVVDDDDADLGVPYVPPPTSHTSPVPSLPTMEALFTAEDGKIGATPTSVLAGLRRLGFTGFRPGQEEAVMRILCGLSTLLITTTGSGKSLCYQLPAYLYRQTHPSCITLVVSPLLSLMDDQVRQFPPGLKGACLHTNQTRPQREKVLREVAEGLVDVLLLSPEALVGGALWSRKCHSHSLYDLPPVSFACIDEAHCVSEWSHNFRPSYLRLRKVLSQRLGVHCLLGLTATATRATELSVAQHLGVAEENILRGPTLPGNLHITVSCDQDRDQGLLDLLSEDPFKDLNSVIIYCTRQQTAETVAQMLRTNFQSWNWNETMGESGSKPTGTRKRKAASSRRPRACQVAECYHAGMAAAQRRSVQNKFMCGTLRIVVATVAFGMGLNKADVRAIIHYNMPKSFESFVQEIGRAGRDGDPAYCHVFMDKEGSDLFELRRHAYSNSVDAYAIKKLVQQVFPVCQCKRGVQDPPIDSEPLPTSKMVPPRLCGGHQVAIPIEATVQSLDVKEECVSTLLCYMELQGWVHLDSHTYDTCTLKCYGGPRQLRALARTVPAVAAAAARLREKGEDLDGSNHMTFSVTELANSMGWESHVVRSELMGLQINDRGTCPAHQGGHSGTVLVEMEALAFRLSSPGDLTPDEREGLIQSLSAKVTEQEKREVEKLLLLHSVLRSVAMETRSARVTKVVAEETLGEGGVATKISLKDVIKQYFSCQGLKTADLAKLGISVTMPSSELSCEEEDLIGRDIASLVTQHSDHHFTGRAIARILHGIPSPLFPALVWGGQRGFWRKHLRVDFNTLCQLATKTLLQLK